jgi:hypothetical protein
MLIEKYSLLLLTIIILSVSLTSVFQISSGILLKYCLTLFFWYRVTVSANLILLILHKFQCAWWLFDTLTSEQHVNPFSPPFLCVVDTDVPLNLMSILWMLCNKKPSFNHNFLNMIGFKIFNTKIVSYVCWIH